MVSQLWTNQNYTSSLPYAISQYIIEYDISKANINALISTGYIDKKTYDYLFNLDKKSREIKIGLMIRDNQVIYKKIQEGIIQAKKLFFEANDIQDEEVLCIKNDAVFVISSRPMQQVFGYYDFKKKNIYTSYIKFFNNIQLFYKSDNVNNTTQFDIKGISDEYKLQCHLNGILGFILNAVSGLESGQIKAVLDMANNYYQNYINRQLPIDHYREFNSDSFYTISATKLIAPLVFKMKAANQSMINDIDINYNLHIVRDILAIVYEYYFRYADKR